MREEILADLAQISSRDIVVTQRSSPNDKDSFWPARNFGDVGRNAMFCAKSSPINAARQALSWTNSTPTYAKDFSLNSNSPNRSRKKHRTFNDRSGSTTDRVQRQIVVTGKTTTPQI